MTDHEMPPHSDEYEQTLARGENLPAFMDFPDSTPVYTIEDDGTNFFIHGLEEKFSTATEAYDHVTFTLKGDVVFKNMERAGKVLGGTIFSPSDRRMLISHTDDDVLRMAKHDYGSFLNLNDKYQANPSDWFTAFYWLNSHPAFYHRPTYSNRWIQDDGLDGCRVEPWKDDNGEIFVTIEHGAWGDEHRVGRRYHDYRLDVYAKTHEEAYVELASKVNMHFNIEGTDRGIKEEPPPYLAEAYKRLDEYEKEKKESGEES